MISLETLIAWNAALFALEKCEPAMKARDELDAWTRAQLVLPKTKRVSRAGRSSTRSLSRSAKVSSLRMMSPPSAALDE